MQPLSKIMVIEDEVDIRGILEFIFKEDVDIAFEFCNSGRDAITKAPSFQPDLILLDVMMPEMDGIMTLEELRKIPATADTPVIFMTAKTQDHEIKYYMQLGALDVIAKPFNPMKLHDSIFMAWENHTKDSSE